MFRIPFLERLLDRYFGAPLAGSFGDKWPVYAGIIVIVQFVVHDFIPVVRELEVSRVFGDRGSGSRSRWCWPARLSR